MSLETEDIQNIGGLWPEYKIYERQKCFVGHSREAEWRDDILSACAKVLPKFGLEPWYAADHFDPTKPLRDKVVELIANARYGIYDLSSWQDRSGRWHVPRNVLIELGMAITLNRPALLLRHTSNKTLPLPACLQGVDFVEFAGETTLKRAMEERLPQWFDVPPDRDWLNRFCIFGNRVCDFREEHPRARQWGYEILCCHVSDGLDKDHPGFQKAEREEVRGAFEDVFSRYRDLVLDYLDELLLIDGYRFILCSHCQTVRSTPFVVYRILPHTPAEVFIAIGMSIALETLFEYDIPKVLLVRQEQDLPSLLRGYEVVEAVNSSEVKRKLKVFIPAVMQRIRETAWKPRPLPFVEAMVPSVEEPVKPKAAPIRVLVVDDNPDSRLRLEKLFRRADWEVSQAQTNTEALDLLTRQRPLPYSLVTTDILRRPERSGEEGYRGLDLVREVNQRFPELPVIFVTTYSSEWVERQAPGLHFDELLDKRWNDEEIIEKVRNVLRMQPTDMSPPIGTSDMSEESTPDILEYGSSVKDLVEFVTKFIVDKPEAVHVSEIQGRASSALELRVAPEDLGRIIGRKGWTINALRIVTRALAEKMGKQVTLEVV